MAKYALTILLLAVTLSHAYAYHNYMGRLAGHSKRGIAKRGAGSDEILEEFTKELFGQVLLLGATSAETPVLEKQFRKADEMKFDTFEDYAKHLLKIFEEVTGRTFSLPDSDESSDESDESSDESPVAGLREIEV